MPAIIAISGLSVNRSSRRHLYSLRDLENASRRLLGVDPIANAIHAGQTLFTQGGLSAPPLTRGAALPDRFAGSGECRFKPGLCLRVPLAAFAALPALASTLAAQWIKGQVPLAGGCSPFSRPSRS